MRTSMTVGGAGATTEQELGELKVRFGGVDGTREM
jgi:hypothetical protein